MQTHGNYPPALSSTLKLHLPSGCWNKIDFSPTLVDQRVLNCGRTGLYRNPPPDWWQLVKALQPGGTGTWASQPAVTPEAHTPRRRAAMKTEPLPPRVSSQCHSWPALQNIVADPIRRDMLWCVGCKVGRVKRRLRA
jgi:hypothetical protein